MPRKKTASNAVQQPFYGLALNVPPQTVNPSGFVACNNVRIWKGAVHADKMGWSPFLGGPLNGPVSLIDTFETSDEYLIFGTPTDLYNWNRGTPVYITPVYTTGTASILFGSTTVTGDSTLWQTPVGGKSTAVTSASSAVFANTITLELVPEDVVAGTPVTDLSNAAAIPAGTLVVSVLDKVVTLSQNIAFTVKTGDQIAFGGQLSKFRLNARIGDYIHFGADDQNSTTATWYKISGVASDTSLTLESYDGPSWPAGTPYTLRQCAVDWADVTPFGRSTEFWSTESFPAAGPPWNSDVWFATNGLDPLIAWTGLTKFAQYVPSVPFISKCLHREKNLMIYGGLTNSLGTFLGTSIANSDNGLPTTMAGGVAFQGVVSDGPFTVTRIGTLGSATMIYLSGEYAGAGDGVLQHSDGEVVSASFVGFPTIWAFSSVIHGKGPLTGRVVAEFPDRHQFIARDGMYRYNGLFVQIMNDQVWRAVLPEIALEDLRYAFNVTNAEFGDLIWGVTASLPFQTNMNEPGVAPSTDPVGIAYVEHYMEQPNSYLFKPYTMRDFPFISSGMFTNLGNWRWDQFTSTWQQFTVPWRNSQYQSAQPIHLVGDMDGNVFTLYTSDTQNGVAFQSFVSFPPRLTIDNRQRGLVQRVYPFFEYDPGASIITTEFTLDSSSLDGTDALGPVGTGHILFVRIALQDATAGPVTIYDTQSFAPDYSAANRFTTHYRRGRWVGVTMYSLGSDVGQPWVLDGYDVEITTGGER